MLVTRVGLEPTFTTEARKMMFGLDTRLKSKLGPAGQKSFND